MNKKEFFTKVLAHYKESNVKCNEGLRTGICYSIREIYWLEYDIYHKLEMPFMTYFKSLYYVAEPTGTFQWYWWVSKNLDIRVKFLNKIINNEI